MAARRTSQDDPVRGDEDVVDAVEAAAGTGDDVVDPDAEPDEFAEDDVVEDDELEAEVAEDDEVAEEDPTEVPLPDEEDEEATIVAAVPAEAAFDDEEEAAVVAVVTGDDEDGEDEIDGLRDGEFVCRSCYMAKLESQLADAERMLCRDCA